MDWKALLDDLRSQTDGVLKQARAKVAELARAAADRLDGPKPGPGGTTGTPA